uniref:Mitochondrial carrier protein n=1 Tax=Ditylum brightwellii TaxID=49249 RepID=A0A7S4VF83_9STRA
MLLSSPSSLVCILFSITLLLLKSKGAICGCSPTFPHGQLRYPLTTSHTSTHRSSHSYYHRHIRGGASASPSTTATASLSVTERLAFGGVSRATAQILLYPIDALRTLAQTRDHRTLADVGAKALIRGCTTTSSFALFIGAIQFGIFGATKQYCGPVVASALGAAGSCIVSVPQEVIKQRLVTGVYASFRQAVKTIYAQEGLLGFYSAWRPTMARNIPFVIATFTANDVLKQKLLKARDSSDDADASDSSSNELSVKQNLLIGVSSALIGAIITHPADVVKTRLMTQAASKALPYTSTMDCIQTIWKTEGVAAFYSGFVQRSAYMGKIFILFGEGKSAW